MPRARMSSPTSLEAYRTHLTERRNQIDAQLLAIEQVMGWMGGTGIPADRAPARAPGRPAGRVAAPKTRSTSNGRAARPGSLREYIAQVMQGGRVMTVSEITDAVRRAGYSTKNKTLSHSVGVMLREMPAVKKVGRGQFRHG
jgi:hypothetical protein